jgi:mono/diheme cytochrome c family protein
MSVRIKFLSNTFAALTCLLIVSACDTGPKSAQGFRLPDGDPETGKQLFVALECNSCHRVINMELPSPAQEGPVLVNLGGPVARVKNYGQLVSSIINPSHKIVRKYPVEEVTRDGESLMPIYNETLTVQQLIDLVAFLQGQYEITLPQYTYYSYQY